MSEPTTQAEVAPAPPVMQALLRRRLGFGVQDFGSAVQPAVQRVQSLERVQRLMRAARALGFQFTNVDLIYGLPRQTPASLARTVATGAAHITVTPLGWDFVRAVAMLFDRHLRADAERSHFSRVP